MSSPSTSKSPKKALSAYNIFFLAERKRILTGITGASSYSQPFREEEVELAVFERNNKGKRVHRKSHGIVSFKELSQQVLTKWRQVTCQDLKLVQQYAKIEKTRYHQEIRKWELSKPRVVSTTPKTTTSQPVSMKDQSSSCSQKPRTVSYESLQASLVHPVSPTTASVSQVKDPLEAKRHYIDTQLEKLMRSKRRLVELEQDATVSRENNGSLLNSDAYEPYPLQELPSFERCASFVEFMQTSPFFQTVLEEQHELVQESCFSRNKSQVFWGPVGPEDMNSVFDDM